MKQMTFDRGTILLTGFQNARTENDDSLFLWDSRVSAYRAPGYRYIQLKQKFNNIQDRVEVLQTSPTLREIPQLRPYQRTALSAWKRYDYRGILSLPTGSGKTLTAIGAIAWLRVPTLILVPTKVLLQQWEMVLSKYFEKSIGVLGDGKRILNSVTVSTFESGYRYMSQIGNRFKLLILDEVHHFGSGIRDEALEMSTCPFRLGLTATNVTKESVQTKLKELVGPTIYELTITELQGEYLSPFDLFTIQVKLTPEEQKSYEVCMEKFRKFFLTFIRSHSRFDWADFILLSKKSSEGRQAFSAWQQAKRIIQFPFSKEESLASLLKQHSQNKSLIFTPDTATAYKISRKHLIMPITADIKRTERERALLEFREGKLKALVSCRVLNEGIDVPDAEVAIIVGGNHGEREHIQRIGRCLRPKTGKKATVYELVARDTLEVKHWRKRIFTGGSFWRSYIPF